MHAANNQNRSMNRSEAQHLAIVAMFTASMWIPYIINRILELGLWPALKQPQAEEPPKALWAKRAVRAHMNAIENLVVFAPIVLAILALDAASDVTASLTFTFLLLRVAHYFAYLLAVPLVRTMLFFGGWLIQLRLGQLLLEVA